MEEVLTKLVTNLEERKKTTENNKLLKISMIVDPRFAYDDDFQRGFEWELIEEDFIEFLLKGLFI